MAKASHLGQLIVALQKQRHVGDKEASIEGKHGQLGRLELFLHDIDTKLRGSSLDH